MPRERNIKEWIGRTDDSMPSDKVRKRIYDRQNGICACGCTRLMDFNSDAMHCDHIKPLADEGENRESNLQMLLAEHHVAKTKVENSQRATALRWQSRAFKSDKGNRNGGFPKAPPQHNATRPLTKGVGLAFFQEIEQS